MPTANATNTPIPVGANIPDAIKAKLKAKSEQFENFYIQQFISLATPDTTENNSFSGGFGEQMFRENLNEQIAKNITQHGGFGISGKVYNELLKLQEQATSNQLQ